MRKFPPPRQSNESSLQKETTFHFRVFLLWCWAHNRSSSPLLQHEQTQQTLLHRTDHCTQHSLPRPISHCFLRTKDLTVFRPHESMKSNTEKEKEKPLKHQVLGVGEACRCSCSSPRQKNGKRAVSCLISMLRQLCHLLLTFLPSALTTNSLLQEKATKVPYSASIQCPLIHFCKKLFLFSAAY